MLGCWDGEPAAASSAGRSQVNDLLRFENDCDVLDIYALDLQEISETSEPVFDCILVTSGYVSDEAKFVGYNVATDIAANWDQFKVHKGL